MYELSFGSVSILSLHITITYRNHYSTKYSKYQKYLFDRIRSYYDNPVSGLGWKKIGDILNSEGLKTPMGKRFKSNNVHSIYTEGKNREERLNTEVEVERKVSIRTYNEDECKIFI